MLVYVILFLLPCLISVQNAKCLTSPVPKTGISHTVYKRVDYGWLGAAVETGNVTFP